LTEPRLNLSKHLAETRLIGRGCLLGGTIMLVVGMRHNFGVMRSIVIAKHMFLIADIRVSIAHADRIA